MARRPGLLVRGDGGGGRSSRRAGDGRRPSCLWARRPAGRGGEEGRGRARAVDEAESQQCRWTACSPRPSSLAPPPSSPSRAVNPSDAGQHGRWPWRRRRRGPGTRARWRRGTGRRRRGRGRSAVAAARARAKTGRGRRAWRGVEKIGMKATLGAVWRDWGKRLRPGGSRDKTVGSTRQF